MLRTTLKDGEADSAGIVNAYKQLSNVERDFRHIKVDDIDLRPIHHRLEARVRSHVFGTIRKYVETPELLTTRRTTK